ncbi:MAG: energy coupling factor transporter S component ThiW [Blautia wexlerae]
MVAIGVVISPILRIEGMCPTAHLINIVCSVLLGPWYSLLCATLIGIIRHDVYGYPATCTDRCRIRRIFIRRFLPRFSWKDYLRSDR